MFPHRKCARLACTGLAVVGGLIAVTASTFAQVTGDLDALKLAAEICQANRDKIKTWSGRVYAASHHTAEGEEDRIGKANHEFFLRIPTKQLCSLTTYLGTGKEGEPDWTRNTLVSEGMLAYRSARGGRATAVQLKQFTKPLRVAPCFSPVKYLGVHGANLAERFTFFLENADNPQMSNWHVTRKDNIVEVVKTGDVEYRYTVDLDQGGNILRFAMSGKFSDTIFEWEYQEVDGVWMPSFYKNEDRRRFKMVDGKRVFAKKELAARVSTVRWFESRINVALPDSDFTLEKLGVKNGDRIHDQRTDKYYDYDAAAQN